MQTLVEWEASFNTLQLAEQAAGSYSTQSLTLNGLTVKSASLPCLWSTSRSRTALRGWLGQTDDRIKQRLLPLLTPTAEELAGPPPNPHTRICTLCVAFVCPAEAAEAVERQAACQRSVRRASAMQPRQVHASSLATNIMRALVACVTGCARAR